MSPANKKTVIFSLSLAIFIDSMGWSMVYPIFSILFLNNITGIFDPSMSLAARNFWFEFALGVYCLGMLIMAPVLGSLSDRFGRKKILILALLGSATGFLVGAAGITLKSFIIILLGRCIAGATAGSLPIAQAAIMDISEEHQKASRLSLVILGNVLGFACGPAISGFFIDAGIWGSHISYELPFVISAVVSLIGALMLALTFKETFQGNPQQRINLLVGFTNLYEAFATRSIRRLCLILTFFLLAWGMFFAVLPVLLTEKFLWTGSNVGYFIVYIALIIAVSMLFLLPRLSRLFSFKTVAFVGFFDLLFCSILYPYANEAGLWILGAVTFGAPFIYISVLTILSKEVSSDEQGKIMGVSGSILGFTWGVGPLLVGYVLRGGLDFTYLVTSLIFVLGILLLCQVKENPASA